MWRRALLLALGVLAIALVVGGPQLGWRLHESRVLSVVIVDKTVPFRNYREHAFVPWLLRTMKVKGPDGRFLDEASDYVGYDPSAKVGHDLEAAHLANADVLLITDTYGVYVGDYEKPGDVAALERSPRIYGGMTPDEAAAVEAFSSRDKLVVAEFNAFASPTEEPARAVLEGTFGVHWSHWVGRYWPEMQDPNEVPRWVGRVYERVYKRPLTVRGPAFVFVREDADMIVLEGGRHLESEVLTLERTKAATELRDLTERSAYWYWLDVVEATNADVLYEHVLHPTSEGAALAAQHGVPLRFPALARRRGRATYYFAGDFVDSGVARGDPERMGLLWWRRKTLGVSASPDERFLWDFYAPILEQLLATRARNPAR